MPMSFSQDSMRVSDFYRGKTIFLTGATGFVGTLLLEVLLRCFPDIVRVYILVRTKNGIEAHDRLKSIFQKKVFKQLLIENPAIESKVHVLRGDVSQPNLGMNEDDVETVINEATIIFHCSAIVKFINSPKDLALQNSKSVDYVIELCRKLRKLDALVYTSTVYANNQYFPLKIEEKIYSLPHSAKRFLDELDNGTTESFNQLAASCKSPLTNCYTFSKALSENILKEKASDLPVAIMRPSVVFCTWKDTTPGYIDKNSSLVKMLDTYAKGILRVICCSSEGTIDIIPGDVVANAHVLAAWIVATGRSSSPFVVHVSSFQKYPIKLREIFDEMYQITKYHSIPNGFIEPDKVVLAEGILYWVYFIYQNYLPGIVFDMISRIQGSKLRLTDINKYLLSQNEVLFSFFNNTYEYEGNNFKKLTEELSEEEKEMLYLDIENLNLHSYMSNLAISSDMYDWKTDKRSPESRKHVVFAKTMFYTFVKRATAFLICYLIYYIISRVLF